MRFRIFTNDVGPNQYSGLCDVEAPDYQAALQKATLENDAIRNCKVLAIPYSEKHFWPNGRTGAVANSTYERYGAYCKG